MGISNSGFPRKPRTLMFAIVTVVSQPGYRTINNNQNQGNTGTHSGSQGQEGAFAQHLGHLGSRDTRIASINRRSLLEVSLNAGTCGLDVSNQTVLEALHRPFGHSSGWTHSGCRESSTIFAQVFDHGRGHIFEDSFRRRNWWWTVQRGCIPAHSTNWPALSSAVFREANPIYPQGGIGRFTVSVPARPINLTALPTAWSAHPLRAGRYLFNPLSTTSLAIFYRSCKYTLCSSLGLWKKHVLVPINYCFLVWNGCKIGKMM